MMALAMALMMTPYSSTAMSSTASNPIKACRKPTMTTASRAKKMSDSFIITLSTTSMAPKKRKVSRYSSSRDQTSGALKAIKL